MKQFVVVYDDFSSARQAVEELIEAGLPRDKISLIANDVRGEHADYLGNTDDVSAAEGAGLGAAIGSLVGLGMAAIPGVGPALAAGVLAGAVTGAAAGGLVGGLVDMGVEEDYAEVYAETLRRGGALVSTEVPDLRAPDAQVILDRYDPIDPDERAAFYKAEGWTGWLPNADPYTSDEILKEQVRLGTMR